MLSVCPQEIERMRHVVLLLIGLFVGAVCAFMAARGLLQRDAYPRGVMTVMQHHLGELRRLERGGHCAAGDSADHLGRIADLSHDVFAALGGDAKADPHLADFAASLARAADAARADSADCPALGRSLRAVGDACEACHRDYR